MEKYGPIMFRPLTILPWGLSGLLLAAPMTAFADAENLKKLWETQGFDKPESVVYDPQREILYVSNINGEIADKDGNGYISRLGLEGEIVQLRWIAGLDGPKGMALYGDRLYVSDIDALVEIDVVAGKIVRRYPAPGAEFANDVAVGRDGTVYMSCTATDAIYRLAGEALEVWMQNEGLRAPNGLLVLEDTLIVGSWGVWGRTDEASGGHLLEVSLADRSIRQITRDDPVGNLDGVEIDLDGDYYVTDWSGGILLHVETDGTREVLLSPGQGSADLEYIAPLDVILIPMLKDGRVLAYEAHHYPTGP